MALQYYADSLVEGSWFRNLTPYLNDAEELPLRARGMNPEVIEYLVQYDRPDIILVEDDNPILVVEKTREVPTGHNVGQRVARLVRAAEFGVPSLLYAPHEARKHGVHTSICQLNPRALAAFIRMWEIHRTPAVYINWPCDDDGELYCDGTEDREIACLLSRFLEAGERQTRIRALQHKKQEMQSEYDQRLVARPRYGSPPASVSVCRTDRLLGSITPTPTATESRILSRNRSSLVYEIGMTLAKCKRQDPYTGMQFVYDYAYCRAGTGTTDKHTNLILKFPNLTIEEMLENNPNNPNSKSSNWYITATAFLCRDGLYVLNLA